MPTLQTAMDFGVVMIQGSDFVREYQWLDSGTPVDLTNAKIVCEIFASKDLAATFTATTAITDAANGKFSITVSAATTAAKLPNVKRSSYKAPERLYNFYEVLSFDVKVKPMVGDYAGLVVSPVAGTIHFYPGGTVQPA